MKTISYIRTIDFETLERRLLLVLCVSLLVLGVLYSMFVSMSVSNVIVRKEAARDIALLEGTLSALESEYLTRKNAVNKEYAYSFGFVDITHKTYVARSPSFGRLSANSPY